MLVVDLDNSLLRTDLLFETLFQALAKRPWATLRALGALRHGKAALKARLSEIAEFDVDGLPFNHDVLALIERERAAGRPVILVSAAHQTLVDAVAAKLGCFDAAYGSDGRRNLGGEAKARFLAERYGQGSFDYLADAAADLPVWEAARRAITVGAPRGLRIRVESIGKDTTHLPGGRFWRDYIEALRPYQWLKNLLVFLPLLGAHETEPRLWGNALIAFVGFCLMASAVYVINDLLDLQSDRQHERKRFRPFASGAVPIAHGAPLATLLLLLAVALAVGAGLPKLLAVLLIYFAGTLAYSLWLKRLLVVDIAMLAGFYTLRLIAGGLSTGRELSPWMLAFSCFVFLSLAAVKRQTELIGRAAEGETDALAGRAYRISDLPVVEMMAIASGFISVLVLALYIDSPEVRLLYASPLKLYAVCPVLLYWISRIVMLAHRGDMHDDPLLFAVRDRISLGCGAATLVFVLVAKYL